VQDRRAVVLAQPGRRDQDEPSHDLGVANGDQRANHPAERLADHGGRATADGPNELGGHVGHIFHRSSRSSRGLVEAR